MLLRFSIRLARVWSRLVSSVFPLLPSSPSPSPFRISSRSRRVREGSRYSSPRSSLVDIAFLFSSSLPPPSLPGTRTFFSLATFVAIAPGRPGKIHDESSSRPPPRGRPSCISLPTRCNPAEALASFSSLFTCASHRVALGWAASSHLFLLGDAHPRIRGREEEARANRMRK